MMEVTVAGHHVEVTEALRQYVESKLARLERHFDHLTAIHCILTVEKLQHRAEAIVQLSGGKIHADATEENMYAAVDGLIDKLDRQVRKYKEKLTDHHAREVKKTAF
jgi:putative sigma-54 modulation protein